MKKQVIVALTLVTMLLFNACSTKPAETTPADVGIANPWSYFDSLEKAEDAAGFPLDLSVVIADTYQATHFGVLNGDITILEVIYENNDHEVTVRKASGEGQDISGVYDTNGSDSDATLKLLDHAGYSWSIYAPDGLDDDELAAFEDAICE